MTKLYRPAENGNLAIRQQCFWDCVKRESAAAKTGWLFCAGAATGSNKLCR